MFRSISTAKAVGAHHIAPVVPCEREVTILGGGVATEYYWKRSDQFDKLNQFD